MNLPHSDNLNIGYLSRMFDRNRVFNCYKYFWMLAILNKILGGKHLLYELLERNDRPRMVYGDRI